MASILDASLGFAPESLYGTAVTPTRWVEHTGESMDYKPDRKQGKGIRAGSRVARSNRRYTPKSEAGGGFELEALSKGQGLLYQLAFGTGVSTLVSTGVYQQVFTLGDPLTSFTLQKGVPRLNADASSTIDALTFSGCMIPSFEISGDQDVVDIKVDVDARDVTKDTAYANPSFPTGGNLFHFAGASVYAGGTLTAPTATALASMTGQVAEVTGWSVKVDRNFDKGYLVGAAGKQRKPVCGEPAITGKLDVEYSSTTFRDAFMSDASMGLVVTYTAGSLTAGMETLQIVIPDIKLDGELPKATAKVQKMGCSFKGFDNLTAAQPIWVVMRTSDAAL